MNALQSKLKAPLQRVAGWYSFAAITLFNTLLLFVLFNLALAVAFYFRGPEPGKPTGKTPTYPETTFQAVYPDFTRAEREQLLRENWTRPFGYDDFVHFRELPFQGKYVNVSEAGFRVSKNQGPWPLQSSNVNVFVFGGSTTFGYGLPDYQTIPSYLQEELSGALKRPICIYNFGVGWYYSTQERIFLERLVSAGHKPDIAIFIDGFNDCWRYDDTPPWRESFETVLNQGARHTIESLIAPTPTGRLMRGLARKTGKINPNFIQDRNEKIIRQIDRYLRKKSLIDGMCRELSITPIFVWQPVPRYKYDMKYYLFQLYPGSYDEQLHGYGQMLKYYQQGLCGSNFLWCADLQQNEKECLYVDQNHYTAKLCKLLAQGICQMALKAGLLDRYSGSRSTTNTARAAGHSTSDGRDGVETQL
jgi:lysophospholipase L1-like esterase